MKQFSRYIFQIGIWLLIWGLLWFESGVNSKFIIVNGLAFLLQVVLLFGLIFYAVPRLLFKKKYVYFFLATIPVILLSAFIATELGPHPPGNRPPMPHQGPVPSGIPSRFFIHLLMLFVSSLTAVLLETFIFAQQKEKSIISAKAELIESELKFLKMQINPHFLFNALNNIYALSVTNSSKTQKSISTLSEMLRYVIYDCEQPKVPLKKELDYIANYIELFKLKSSKHFEISFDKNVIDENAMVAPMLFVPYIENAFKHSGIETGKDSFVHISLLQNENNIQFSVENSNPSTPSFADSQGGIGLPNVQKRLEILYPERHILKITKTNIFKVNLTLTLQ